MLEPGVNVRKRLELGSDEVISDEEFKKEFDSFLAKLCVVGTGSYTVTVPKEIVKALGLKKGSLLEVAVRVADAETIREYGFAEEPSIRRTGQVSRCPACGRPGIVYLILRGEAGRPSIRIRHSTYECPPDVSEGEHPRSHGRVPSEEGFREILRYPSVSIRVKCPVCGEEGTLARTFAKRELRVRHRKPDGGTVHHYLNKRDYSELYDEVFGPGKW